MRNILIALMLVACTSNVQEFSEHSDSEVKKEPSAETETLLEVPNTRNHNSIKIDLIKFKCKQIRQHDAHNCLITEFECDDGIFRLQMNCVNQPLQLNEYIPEPYAN